MMHTSGPWRAVEIRAEHICIDAPTGTVARVPSFGRMQWPNALLIAAAPALLEALKATHPPAVAEKHAAYAGSCGACAAIALAENPKPKNTDTPQGDS